jgi:hypothetical protein
MPHPRSSSPLAPVSKKGSTSAHGVVIACQLALYKDAFFGGMKSDFVDLKMGEKGRFEGLLAQVVEDSY